MTEQPGPTAEKIFNSNEHDYYLLAKIKDIPYRIGVSIRPDGRGTYSVSLGGQSDDRQWIFDAQLDVDLWTIEPTVNHWLTVLEQEVRERRQMDNDQPFEIEQTIIYRLRPWEFGDDVREPLSVQPTLSDAFNVVWDDIARNEAS